MPQRVASSVKGVTRSPDWRTDRYDVARYVLENGETIPAIDIDRAAQILAPLDEGSSLSVCAMEIARLKVLTKAAKQTDDDMSLQIACMADELTAYPPDVVRGACRNLARSEVFFPSWSELAAEADYLVLKRRCLLRALRHIQQENAAQLHGEGGLSV